MLDWSWSKLIKTPIGRLAEINYSADPRRHYHGWGSHILRGYHHAKKFGFEYDVNVDAAWLGHDWIYDEHADKELRSIEAFHDAVEQTGPIEGLDMGVVDALIESTINHSYVEDSRIIKMDLADLTDRTQTVINYGLIKAESRELYNISDVGFAEGSVNFMTGMRRTMMTNSKVDPDGGTFWSLVMRGVDQTIAMSEDILDDHNFGPMSII